MNGTLFHICLVFGLLLGVGCVTKSKARLQTQEAFLAGQRQAMAQHEAHLQSQKPHVSFRGQFKNRTIPWTEGMTLAQAILEANYLANWEPYEILLTRQGTLKRIKTKRMLSGLDNPLLESGDQIEILR